MGLNIRIESLSWTAIINCSSFHLSSQSALALNSQKMPKSSSSSTSEVFSSLCGEDGLGTVSTAKTSIVGLETPSSSLPGFFSPKDDELRQRHLIHNTYLISVETGHCHLSEILYQLPSYPPEIDDSLLCFKKKNVVEGLLGEDSNLARSTQPKF